MADMIKGCLDGEEGWYAPAYLRQMAAQGSQDAMALLDPAFAAAREASRTALVAIYAVKRLQRIAEHRIDLNPWPGGIAPMAPAALELQVLQPLLDHMNALLKTGACARVCRSWCGAVVAWRRAMRRIGLDSTDKHGHCLTDASLRALVRECPLVEAFSLCVQSMRRGVQSMRLISSAGLEALGGLGHLRHLHLISFGTELTQARGALKAIGAGCPHLEYVHLPLTTGAALQELLRPAQQRLQQLFVQLLDADADTISALARCTTLRALGVSLADGRFTFDTVALRTLAEGLTALELLRLNLNCSSVEVTPEKDLVALVEALAMHAPRLQHLALWTEVPRSSVEYHQLPPPTDETWHQHIHWDQQRDANRHSYNEECAMALRFPTQQAVADEMHAIDAALTALGKGCPLLEHLELPGGLSVYRPRWSYHPDAEPLFVSAAAAELSFPKLRHFGVGSVGAGQGIVALGTIQALGEAAPELRTLALGNCFRMVDTPDPIDALNEALNACPRLLMLDVTNWPLDVTEAMDVINNPDVHNPANEEVCTQPCLYSTKYGDMFELAEPVGDWFQNGRNTPEQLRQWTPNGLLTGNEWQPATSCLCVGCRSYAELMQ